MEQSCLAQFKAFKRGWVGEDAVRPGRQPPKLPFFSVGGSQPIGVHGVLFVDNCSSSPWAAPVIFKEIMVEDSPRCPTWWSPVPFRTTPQFEVMIAAFSHMTVQPACWEMSSLTGRAAVAQGVWRLPRAPFIPGAVQADAVRRRFATIARARDHLWFSFVPADQRGCGERRLAGRGPSAAMERTQRRANVAATNTSVTSSSENSPWRQAPPAQQSPPTAVRGLRARARGLMAWRYRSPHWSFGMIHPVHGIMVFSSLSGLSLR